jgi:uncharacterized Fe-S center protein
MEISRVYYTDMHATGEMNLLQKLKHLMAKSGFEHIHFSAKFVAVKLHFGEPGESCLFKSKLCQCRLQLYPTTGRQTLCH